MKVTQKKQIDQTVRAQCLEGMMGHSSQHDFENLVHDKMIQSCPITHKNVMNAYKIFGPDFT